MKLSKDWMRMAMFAEQTKKKLGVFGSQLYHRLR
jgi:hypothetical protein